MSLMTTTPVRMRAPTHAKLRQLAQQHRLTMADAMELAVEAFVDLSLTDRRAMIEGKPRRKRAKQT